MALIHDLQQLRVAFSEIYELQNVWRIFYILSKQHDIWVLFFCHVFMSDILPLFPSVPSIVEFGDTYVKANAKCKCTCKDGTNEHAIALEEGTVECVGERH